VELSSFQLEVLEDLHCISAAVLNISEDHMDRYDSLLEYAYVKSKIFKNTQLCVLNKDDILVSAMLPAVCSKVVWCSMLDGTAYYSFLENNLLKNQQLLLSANELTQKGKHNAFNALFVLALLEPLNIDQDTLLSALKSFVGLPHRIQFVDTIKQVTFIDDSKGTNVGATIAAINSFDEPIILIAGGDSKGQNFMPLAQALIGKVKSIVLIGKDADLLYMALSSVGIPIVQEQDLSLAVNTAMNMASSGDLVLLSPACSSLDMFKNYEHRSQVFCNAVHQLKMLE
jgi:UDP-N-acetylmuramoylalanine--D-glutamate ligase